MGKRRAKGSHSSKRVASLSLCMIVRDEADVIGQCLESVRGLVHEIVVIDTGSSDDTTAIAREFGAKVIEQVWESDFAKHRNASIAAASGDWILVLDADEAIDISAHPHIRNLIKNRRCCYSLTQRHYTNSPRLDGFKPVSGEFPRWERDIAGFFESKLVRLFPNHRGIEYRGVVHELTEPSISEKQDLTITDGGVLLHHYGYLRSEKKEAQKNELYTALGRMKTSDNPDAWKNYHELGIQSHVNRNFADAIENFTRALAINSDYVPTWINYGYVLGECCRYDEAKAALETAIKLDPRNCEAWCNLGVVYLRTVQYTAAASCFLQALKLNRTHVNSLCNLGETFLALRVVHKAAESYRMVLDLMPSNARAKEGLGNCYVLLGNLKEAEPLLLQAASQDAARSKAYLALSHICQVTERINEAIKYLDKFCEAESKLPNADPVLLATAETEKSRLRDRNFS